MSKARYRFNERSEGIFQLYEDGELLCEFTRLSFRERMEFLGRGPNWIGSMLRLFHRTYPMTFKETMRSPLDKVRNSLGDHGIADYLRQKGYHVFRPLPVPDDELISYVKSRGYIVEHGGVRESSC
jgi:hypothetical protein